MRSSMLPLLLAFLGCLGIAMADAPAVFAHVVVGVFSDATQDTWVSHIKTAKAAAIDGFVLNIGAPWVDPISSQMQYAFAAANSVGDFKLFFSFDYLGGSGAWAMDEVIEILKAYGTNPAHFQFEGKPYVSTFEGTSNIGDWSTIRSSVPSGIFFVPDWTSLGPVTFTTHQDIVDGVFSWDMWPQGPNDMTTASDIAWKAAVGGKHYMMGVSPWFYTNLPGWDKQYTWRGDSLWHDRWEQVQEIMPNIVQIVSWNDYGESHYIGPTFSPGVPSGSGTDAHAYVDNMEHDGWLNLLPYYIGRFKGSPPSITQDKAQIWYRLTPKNSGSTGGVQGGPCYPGQACYTAPQVVQDKIFITALVKAAATVQIQVGSNAPTNLQAPSAGLNHFGVPFNGQTGPVLIKVLRNGAEVIGGQGQDISAAPADGTTNFNAWVGYIPY